MTAMQLKARERWLEVHDLRERQKLTFREIGEQLGVTRERARQLYLRAGRNLRSEQARRDEES
jgi:DNA-directed RNA polymerase sigma subunit (sigma70/sigma32)